MDVLVLNADPGPLHRVNLRHAVRRLVRRVAEVHGNRPGPAHRHLAAADRRTHLGRFVPALRLAGGPSPRRPRWELM